MREKYGLALRFIFIDFLSCDNLFKHERGMDRPSNSCLVPHPVLAKFQPQLQQLSL